MLIVEIIVLILAVLGVVFNNKKVILCFPIWMISNAMAGYIHMDGQLYGMLVRDLAFFVLCIQGWYCWRRDPFRRMRRQNRRANRTWRERTNVNYDGDFGRYRKPQDRESLIRTQGFYVVLYKSESNKENAQ